MGLIYTNISEIAIVENGHVTRRACEKGETVHLGWDNNEEGKVLVEARGLYKKADQVLVKFERSGDMWVFKPKYSITPLESLAEDEKSFWRHFFLFLGFLTSTT